MIFEEETNDDKYQKYYNEEKLFKSLEGQSIIKYLRNHDIMHIPVDCELNRNLTFKKWDSIFDTFKKYNAYKIIVKEHCMMRDKEGFAYLNSEKCSELFAKMKHTEKQIIGFNGTNFELIRIYSLFHKEHDYRENLMLQSIYNYSRENRYKQAVFLLGFAHRKSIMQKILNTKRKKIIN